MPASHYFHPDFGYLCPTQRFFWALNGTLNKPADLRTDDRVANLEDAKSQLRASWVTWLRWAGLSEME